MKLHLPFLLGWSFLSTVTVVAFQPIHRSARTLHSRAFNNRAFIHYSQRRGTTKTTRTITTMSSSNDDNDATITKPTKVAQAARELNLFIQTPLVKSLPLTKLCNGRPVYLKLDTLQTSGSFKDRGMAHLCQTLVEQYYPHKPTLISSSGGNAGLAVTTVGAQALGMNVQVIVPQTTKPLVIEKLQSLGAQVTVHGANWNEADALARQRVDELNSNNDKEAYYVPPYDNPLLWEGHSSLIDELMEELPPPSTTEGQPHMGAIIASIGGGGLICGILEGLERYAEETKETVVVCAETLGAASFGKAWEQPDQTSKTNFSLTSIDSIATSLGALQVTPVAIERAQRHQETTNQKDSVVTSLCTDEEAIDACIQFASQHRILVEPACGAALAVLYSSKLRSQLLENNSVLQKYPMAPIVVEVCGGSGVNVDLLSSWKNEYLS